MYEGPGAGLFHVSGITEESVLDSKGAFVPSYVVTYTVPNLGNFTENFPKANFSEEQALERIGQEVEKLHNLIMSTMPTHNNG